MFVPHKESVYNIDRWEVDCVNAWLRLMFPAFHKLDWVRAWLRLMFMVALI